MKRLNGYLIWLKCLFFIVALFLAVFLAIMFLQLKEFIK